MKRIYIAGPYRNDNAELQQLNIVMAQMAGAWIAEKGYFPIVPHNLGIGFGTTQPAEFWLEGTLAEMLTCDGVFFLPTWKTSEGAKNEYRVAAENNMKIYHNLSELP